MRFFILSFLLIGIFCKSAYATDAASDSADDSLETTKDVLQYLSCETGFIADSISYGAPYTCVSEPLLDQLISAMLTFGQSNAMTIRLKMNHEELYPKNCARSNRADPWDPKISFGFCNNTKLIGSNFMQLIKGATTGSSIVPPVSDYIIDYKDKKDGYTSIMADAGYPTGIIGFAYKVAVIQDKICLTILTLAGNYRPVGCKYMAEPYPKSIYETKDEVATTGNDISTCNSVYNCSENAKIHSQTLIPVLSPIIACVREMILRLVISTEVCNPTQTSKATSNNMAEAFAQGMDNGSMIHKFQSNMQKAVTALLTLYVILFGIKVATGGANIRTRDMVNFVVKFLLVTYFSIGINMTSSGSSMRFDGMTQLLFPFLLSGVTEIASWVMNTASINGLCEFPKDLYPNTTDINMPLWDQIDCRLAYYIGYDGLVELLLGNAANDPVKHQVPPYVFMLIPAIILGNEQLIMMALTYPIMIISFVAYTLCMFVSSLILILILGVMAPIFVPCALFNFTYEYFSKWWKTLFGLMLQPAIALTFMALMFAVYDRAFYGTCIYNSVTVNYKKTPEENKTYRTFFMTLDPNQYKSQTEINGCMSSLGFFLNNPLQSVFGTPSNPNLSMMQQAEGTITVNQRDPENIESMPDKPEGYMNGVDRPKLEWKSGLMTQSPKMFWEELVGMIKNFIVCFIMLTVLKNLMNSIVGFITGLSGSEVKAGGVFDPGEIQAKLTEVASMAAGAAAKGADKAKSQRGGAEGAPGGEGSSGGDKVASGGKGEGKGASKGGSGKPDAADMVSAVKDTIMPSRDGDSEK